MALTNLVAFCLLDDLKSDLGISGSANDSRLEAKVLQASELIEAYCGRQFRYNASRVEKLAGYGTTRLLPNLTPIASVASVFFEDGAEVSASSYVVETDTRGDGWALYAETGWERTGPGVQTISATPVALIGEERAAFTVTYAGGYSLPNDSVKPGPLLPTTISEACLMLACTLWRQRGRDANVIAESVGDASIQLGFIGGIDSAPRESFGIPAGIAAMLDAYKRVA